MGSRVFGVAALSLESNNGRVERGHAVSAICGMAAGPVLLAAGWAATMAQPDEFSFVSNATSDLGADTADLRWVSNQLGSNLPGLLVLVFAIGLWNMLGGHRSARIGTGLVAAVGLGFFLTGIFTLDCREIDTGCENNSWQASVHLTVAGLLVLALFLSPFVVARALRFAEGWRDLRVPSLVCGVLTVAAAIAGSVLGEGLGAYAAVVPWFAWITILSVRMLRVAQPGDALARGR